MCILKKSKSTLKLAFKKPKPVYIPAMVCESNSFTIPSPVLDMINLINL